MTARLDTIYTCQGINRAGSLILAASFRQILGLLFLAYQIPFWLAGSHAWPAKRAAEQFKQCQSGDCWALMAGSCKPKDEPTRRAR